MDMKFNIDNHAAKMKTSFVDVHFSKLETELKDYVIKQEVQYSLTSFFFLSY